MTFIAKKISRNQLCPCNSGKKFKKCHGNDGNSYWPPAHILEVLIKEEKKNQLPKGSLGLARPIISFPVENPSFEMIAIGNQIRWGKWKTFHDFLLDYIRFVFGEEWENLHCSRPISQRHILLQWLHKVCEYRVKTTNNTSEISSVPMIGAVEAYMRLSYHLFLLQHNVELQKPLIERLKNETQFPGAYYETYVYAWLIKAGFQIEFEDEGDRSKSHCECNATDSITGKKFSVEAKSINRYNSYGATTETTNKSVEECAINQIVKALKKEAAHDRIIFVNLNLSIKEYEQGLSL